MLSRRNSYSRLPVYLCVRKAADGARHDAATAIAAAAYMRLPIAVLAQQMKTGVQSMSLMTIPLFIVAGEIMSEGGISQRLDQVTSAKAASQASANGTRAQSIIGIGQTATDALQAGIGDFLYILIVINIFFGVFNLFPMLPLDGGHVAIAVYEKIRTGRRSVMYHADVAKLLCDVLRALACHLYPEPSEEDGEDHQHEGVDDYVQDFGN